MERRLPQRPRAACREGGSHDGERCGLSIDFYGLLSSPPVSNSADMVSRAFQTGWAGAKVGQVHESVRRYAETVRSVTTLPLVAKMTPSITDTSVPAMHAKSGGANGISAINTVRGLAGIDPDTWVPTLGVFGKGAISGILRPAVQPIGLRFTAELTLEEPPGLPLSGIGGIETWVNALEYLPVGASTVQVTTGVIHYGYGIVAGMIEGLSDSVAMRGIQRGSELVGRALQDLHEIDAFDLRGQGNSAYNLARCVGCGACLTACSDAGGQALFWYTTSRRPRDEGKSLGCKVCRFVRPVPGPITFREMPEGWSRAPTPTLGVEVRSFSADIIAPVFG